MSLNCPFSIMDCPICQKEPLNPMPSFNDYNWKFRCDKKVNNIMHDIFMIYGNDTSSIHVTIGDDNCTITFHKNRTHNFGFIWKNNKSSDWLSDDQISDLSVLDLLEIAKNEFIL